MAFAAGTPPVTEAAPSWISATMTSASPFSALPSDSLVATRFTASTGSPNSMPVMPSGLTRDAVSWVTAPMMATSTPLTVLMTYSSRAGVSVPRS